MNKGVKGSACAYGLITKLDRVIAAILIGNNLVNILISILSTMVFVSLFGPVWGVAAATLCLALFLLIMCDITPKTLAIRYSEKTALFTAPILEFIIKLFNPVVDIFIGISNFVLRVFGAHPVPRSALISEEELKLMIEVGKEEGVISDQERRMLHKIFEFGDTKVEDVMVAKDKITAIEKSANEETLFNILSEEGYGRIPVYSKVIDDIIGIIYSRDLLYIMRNKTLVVLDDLIRQAYYVSAQKRVSELLREFQAKRIQIAIVVDKNKKTLGLVTLEDLIEEIVGEIEEEKLG